MKYPRILLQVAVAVVAAAAVVVNTRMCVKYEDRNPEYIMYVYAKKLLNQKNYIMKNKKMTEIYMQEMKKQLQEREVI